MAQIRSVDVFCRVVDNLGDAGVCWRLVRQLRAELGLQVRLWIDQPETLRRFVLPGTADAALMSELVLTWSDQTDFGHPLIPADLALETFGCDLPEPYAFALAARVPAARWINLEYLSAEAWIDGCHGLPSPHPSLPIVRRFFFPGFSPESGGLLREAGLLDARRLAQATRSGADAPVLEVSLFCYSDAPVAALLDAFEAGTPAVRCYVFQGPAQEAARAWSARHGVTRTELVFLPWLTQPDFDHILWRCDCNFVRGEDSFVRAQWAGRPFVWDCYPQADQAHHVKVNAFLQRYTAALERESAEVLAALWQGWVGRTAGSLSAAWQTTVTHLPDLRLHAEHWCAERAQVPDLTTALLALAAHAS